MMVKIEGQSFHVEIEGVGEPLLLLHGFTGDSSSWSSFIQSWSSSFQVVAIDLIGHGKSSKPLDPSYYSMEAMSSTLKKLLDHLGLNKIHILGYSMGGRFALSFTLQYPSYVKSLILESSSPGLKTSMEREERRQRDHALAERIIEKGIVDFVEFWETIPLFASQQQLPEEVQSKTRAQRLRNSEIGLSNSLKGMGTGAQKPLWNQLNRLDIPVLLITGELDKKFISIAKQMEKAISQADFVQINDAGHTIHVEHPQIFDKIVVAFLKKHADSFL
ncbi:MAG: 2-succinyl-6-hydroxy-2,4-cyclohexadiene-1-carboxylate synthase [Anaerobacillus sp.]